MESSWAKNKDTAQKRPRVFWLRKMLPGLFVFLLYPHSVCLSSWLFFLSLLEVVHLVDFHNLGNHYLFLGLFITSNQGFLAAWNFLFLQLCIWHLNLNLLYLHSSLCTKGGERGCRCHHPWGRGPLVQGSKSVPSYCVNEALAFSVSVYITVEWSEIQILFTVIKDANSLCALSYYSVSGVYTNKKWQRE
jgi:hypothetical protein